MKDLISSLNEEQKSVVLHIEGPALVIAGPGSGKTRALTHKIAYLIQEGHAAPNEILAVTFTNKAASEVKERVAALLNDEENLLEGFDNATAMKATVPQWVGTFHSVCSRILRIEATEEANLGFSKNFVIYDTDDSQKLIKDILKEMDISAKDLDPKGVLSSISKAKSELMEPDEFADKAAGSYYFERIAKIYPKYQKRIRENNALDFDDILYEVVKLFKKDKNVLEKYQNRFRFILIDEYQDTNKVQYNLVKQLAAKHHNLTVVGDVSQSIYSWRGADYRNMMQFEKDYPEAKTYKLAQNYRSTGNILNAAKTLIENNETHIPLELYTSNSTGEAITLFEAENERAEAGFISDTISLLSVGVGNGNFEGYPEDVRYKEFAILYRTNAQSRVLEESLLKAGIPYKIIGGVRFYDRKEIKDAIAYLRVFHNPLDEISWGRCINVPTRGIGPKSFEKLREANFDLDLVESATGVEWRKYIEHSGETKPIEMLDAVLKDFGYLEYLNDGTEESLGRIENLKELRTVAKQYLTLGDFLENIALVESSNKAALSDDNTVTLMTLHAAKGLEFETVFLAGLEEGIFPHSRALADPKELEEERRLCYVGITRAKKTLYMTYTRSRTFFGQTNGALISRFIGEIPENLLDFRFG